MTRILIIWAHGVPQPAGSKNAIVVGGKARLVDGRTKNAQQAHRTWRQDVIEAAIKAIKATTDESQWSPIEGPVHLYLDLYLPKPKSVRKDAQATKRPDATKLLRATEDALTVAGVWRDDSQVIELHVTKRYASDANPVGARILIEAM